MMRFKRRKSKADLQDQLAAESRMVAFLWQHIDDVQGRMFVVIDEQHDWRNKVQLAETEARLAKEHVLDLKEELDDMRALWHPPTVDEAFAFAQAKLNPDYNPIPREIEWGRAPLHSTIVSAKDLGEQPPIYSPFCPGGKKCDDIIHDGPHRPAVSSGSLDWDEDLPIPIRHEGPGL